MAATHLGAPGPQGTDRAGQSSAPGPDADDRPQTRELDQLREILFGEERARITRLARRISDPGQRTSDLADVLPDVVRNAGSRLATALEVPVERSLQRSVEQNPQQLADALFPVMGPAIRRSIGEMLKGLVQSINQAVEHSISPRGILWRIEAWRSGTSFAEVVLKNTLVYRVDAAYLIHNATGLLIDHAVATSETTLKDEDAVSAMLTAIQDSFSQSGDPLETVEIGGRTLWVLRGPQATLACLISGLPPQSLREQLESILIEAHAAFGTALAEFDGDKGPMAAVHPLLTESLALEYRSHPGSGRKVRWWPWIIAAILLAAAAGWLGWQEYTWNQRLEKARRQLAATPGIVLVDWSPGRQVRAGILADPLAQDPIAQITDPEVANRIIPSSRPYISADPPIVLERARRQLMPPAGVALALDSGVLRVSGSAPPHWVQRVTDATILPPGVDRLDLSGLASDQSDLMARLRAAIAPPEGVGLTLHDTDLTITGTAPLAWLRDLPERLATVGGLGACDDTGLEIAELVQTRSLIDSLAEIEVRFGEAVNPLAGATEAIDQAAALLEKLITLDHSLDLGLKITLLGSSDGIGDQRWSHWLRQQRADYVAQLLAERGIPPQHLKTQPTAGYEPSAVARPEERWVRLRAEVRAPERHGCTGN